MIRFNIEKMGPWEFFGWAHDDEPGAGKVSVCLPTTQGHITVTSDIYKEHLRKAGIGDGYAGFMARLDGGVRFSSDTTIRLVSDKNQIDVTIPRDFSDAMREDAAGGLFLNKGNPFFRCVLVLIIKNEKSYVPEWIEYHRELGVDHFIVFDNESSDGLDDLINPYVKMGIVTYVRWPRINNVSERDRTRGWLEQDTAYACAVRLLIGRAKWVGFLDVDEFLVPQDEAENDLVNLLDSYGSPTVTFFWRMFGTSGIEKKPDGLVIENYKNRASDSEFRLSKFFIRPEAVHHLINAHRVACGPDRLLAFTTDNVSYFGGQKLKASYRGATVHHYHTRSRQEFMEKVRRGWPENDRSKQYNWEDHFLKHDTNEVFDESALRFAAAVKSRLDKMLNPSFDNESRCLVSRNWLLELPTTVLFDCKLRKTSSGWNLRGYVVDLMMPSKRYNMQVHDGFGGVLVEGVADRSNALLELMRVSDSNYGFEFEFSANGNNIYIGCEKFNASIRLCSVGVE